VLHRDWSDSPTDYLIGVVTVVSKDRIEVGYERDDGGIEMLRTYSPTDEEPQMCG
jgi:hypothetical protein